MTDNLTIIENAFEPLVAAAKDNPRALLMLAVQAQQRGAHDRGYELARDAAALAGDDAEIAAMARDIIARCVPNWHLALVKDGPRNDAFQRALERAVTPDCRVLDIGSGTGLLAMMAARAGATEVHSCELNPAMAVVAKEIVAANGFGESITIHTKNSAKLDADADLGGKVDIIVSEILGSDVVCEFVLPTMRDAVKRLTKPGAKLIPSSAAINVALAWWPAVEMRRVDEINGFDLSILNSMRRAHYMVVPTAPDLVLRGEDAVLYDFDFNSTDAVSDKAAAELVSTGGQVNGVVQWISMQMDEQESYDIKPGPGQHSSWSCLFFPFEKAIDTAPGDKIAIGATIAGNRLRVWQAD